MPSRPDQKQEQLSAIARENNAKLLSDFSNWLSATHLSKEAIRRHVQNVKSFIDMLSDQAILVRCGVDCIAVFLGGKLIGTGPNSLLEHAASLRKFYTYLNETGKTSDEELQVVITTIKIRMPEWLAKTGFHRSEDTEPPAM